MKIHAFHFLPHGMLRTLSHLAAGRKLCRATNGSLRGLLPDSIPCMTAAWNFYETLRSNKMLPPKSIIDVGANISQMTRLLMMSCGIDLPRIISFEPNTALNPLGEVHRLALSDRDGEAKFYLPSNDDTWGTIEPNKECVKKNTVNKAVRCSRFATLVDEKRIVLEELPRPLLVKIDTEGAEKRVLDGFGRYAANVDYFLIEVENRETRGLNYDFLSLARLLGDAGFTNCKILYTCCDGNLPPSYSDVLFWRQ